MSFQQCGVVRWNSLLVEVEGEGVRDASRRVVVASLQSLGVVLVPSPSCSAVQGNTSSFHSTMNRSFSI